MGMKGEEEEERKRNGGRRGKKKKKTKRERWRLDGGSCTTGYGDIGRVWGAGSGVGGSLFGRLGAPASGNRTREGGRAWGLSFVSVVRESGARYGWLWCKRV
ncbi:hypothetical protein IEQ34_008050 [Dendrobium chrysotoxum]|uniref:Uncharacterized protein n=1 Tax=Dendrobium chrysotoxum TaxID=161865 RepID=A0AAV7H659_DENCH|nr:hypothetical protein IEQ34_008050 [Dendrobium chrysotoxum]